MEIIPVLILSCHYLCRLTLLILATNDRLFVQLQRHQSPPSEPYIYPLFCIISNLLKWPEYLYTGRFNDVGQSSTL